MKKITSLMLLLLFAVTTWAQSTILDRDLLLATKNGNNQYEFTSGTLTAPDGDFNKLRITFLENSNGEKPAGFPCIAIAEFYLYDNEGNAVTLAASNFSSNATHVGEGSIDKLCDGSTTQQDGEGANDWYWHSQWSGTPSPYGHHYLEIDLSGITADLTTYKIGL